METDGMPETLAAILLDHLHLPKLHHREGEAQINRPSKL